MIWTYVTADFHWILLRTPKFKILITTILSTFRSKVEERRLILSEAGIDSLHNVTVVVMNDTAMDRNITITGSTEWGWLPSTETCIYVYSGLVASLVVLSVCSVMCFFTMCMRASISLHNSMFASLTRATMWFFNNNSSGIWDILDYIQCWTPYLASQILKGLKFIFFTMFLVGIFLCLLCLKLSLCSSIRFHVLVVPLLIVFVLLVEGSLLVCNCLVCALGKKKSSEEYKNIQRMQLSLTLKQKVKLLIKIQNP